MEKIKKQTIPLPHLTTHQFAKQVAPVWRKLQERFLERAKEAKTEAERRAAAHDAREKTEAAERKAAELRRKLDAAESRRARAETPYTPYQEPPQARKHDKRGKSLAQQLEHEVWVSPAAREARTQAGEEKKQLAHTEAVARKAQAVVDAQKAKETEIGKLQALKDHELPPVATVDAVLAAALEGA